MADPKELAKVQAILAANAKKTFVQRIMNREKFPTLDLGNGQHATHKMAWASADGKYRVYPTVLYDGSKLVEYDPKTAYQHILKSGNFIDFDTPEEAEWFSQRYKSVWGE